MLKRCPENVISHATSLLYDKYNVYLNNFSILKKSSKKYEKYNLDGMKFIMRKIKLKEY